MKYTVSIIIPVLNAEKTIRKTLQSILNQSYTNIELIVVDNGSTDSTLEQIKSLKKEIKILRCETPGSGPARNYGVEKSAGQIVAFLDSDDIWHPEKLTTQISSITDELWNNTIMGCYARFVTQSGKYLGSSPRSSNDKASEEALLMKGTMPFPTSTWIMSKSVFMKVGGFNSDYHLSQDFEFLVRAATLGFNFQVVREKLCDYLVHDSSETYNHYVGQALTARYVLENLSHRSSFELSNFIAFHTSQKTSLWKKASSGSDFRRSMYLFGQSRYFSSIFYAFKSFLKNPKDFIRKIINQGPWWHLNKYVKIKDD